MRVPSGRSQGDDRLGRRTAASAAVQVDYTQDADRDRSDAGHNGAENQLHHNYGPLKPESGLNHTLLLRAWLPMTEQEDKEAYQSILKKLSLVKLISLTLTS